MLMWVCFLYWFPFININWLWLDLSVVRHFQEYVEPNENSQTVTSPPRRNAPNPLHPLGSVGDPDHVLLPLDESTLTHNLGIPIVVAITKVCNGSYMQH